MSEFAAPMVTIPGLDRTISRVGLGGMSLSLPGRPARSDAKRVIRAAVEAGVTLIDTADAYAVDQTEIGHNETLIAEALGEMALSVADGPVLVATKGGRTRTDGDWGIDGRPAHLRAACEASLRALKADRIPLYQLHTPDPDVPLADSIGALSRLRDEGKIAAIGVSNVSVDEIEKAREVAPVAAVQNLYSVWDVGYRTSPVVAYCVRNGIALLAYSPLGGRERASSLSDSIQLGRLADELHASVHELALAWLAHQAPIVVPIAGASRVLTAVSAAKSATIELDAPTLRRLQAAFRSLPGSRGLLSRIAAKVMRQVARGAPPPRTESS